MIVRLIPLDARHPSYGPLVCEAFRLYPSSFAGRLGPTTTCIDFEVGASYCAQVTETSPMETPRDADLTAENEQLRAENKRLQ